jgi:multiple sugar transport system substrate-binding protein
LRRKITLIVHFIRACERIQPKRRVLTSNALRARFPEIEFSVGGDLVDAPETKLGKLAAPLTRRTFIARSGAVALAAAAAPAALLAACSPSASAAPSVASTSAASAAPGSTPTAPPTSQGVVNLKYWKYRPDDDVDKAKTEEVFQKWNSANPDIQVALEPFPFEDYIGAKLTTAFASGTGPDLFIMSPGAFLDYVNDGIAAPLDDVIAPYASDFLELPLAAATVNGHVYGIPYEMEPVGLFYRKDILSAAGIQPPKTFDELLAAAQALTNKDRKGIAIELKPGVYQNFTWYPFLWGAGDDVVNADWSVSGMRSDAAAAALDLWGSLINKGYAPTQLATDTGDIGYLGRGEVAMQVCGVWAIDGMRKQFANVDYGIVPLPAPAGQNSVAIYGGWKQLISSRSAHVDAAKKFAQWLRLSNEGWQEAWACGYKIELSPRKSIAAACAPQYTDPHIGLMVDTIVPIARSEPRFPSGIVQPVSDAIQAVMFGGKTGKEAGAAAADAIEAFVKTYSGAH